MRRMQRSRSFAPTLNTLESRALLSGMGSGMPTEVVVTETPVFNKMMTEVVSVHLTAEVKALPMAGMSMGTPTGKVTVDMVMPAEMSMSGMKAGITKLRTLTLRHGGATLTLKSKDVVGMPLQVMYGGSKTFASSMATPPVQTESLLMSEMNMSGMSMARR